MLSLNPFKLLRFSAFLIFSGRAWGHFNGNVPYRDLFWDEHLLSGVVETFSKLTWKEYVTHPGVDRFIVIFSILIGIIFVLSAIVSLTIKQGDRFQGRLLLTGSFLILFLSVIHWKVHFFQIGQLMEYTIQWASPLVLFMVTTKNKAFPDLLTFMKVAIALTFVGHGLYAIGFHPVPGNFVEMIISILGISEGSVQALLKVAGILDFIIAIMIFLPKRFSIPALTYATVWGVLTALARIWSYFLPQFTGETLNWWLPETILRLPHGLFPLIVLILILNVERTSKG